VALVFYEVPKEYPQLHVYCVINILILLHKYEGWNFNSGNYLFTTDTK